MVDNQFVFLISRSMSGARREARAPTAFGPIWAQHPGPVRLTYGCCSHNQRACPSMDLVYRHGNPGATVWGLNGKMQGLRGII